MVVAALVQATSETLKAVQVELSLKRSNLGEFKVFGQKLLEEFRFVDDKAASVRLPRYNVSVAVLHDILKHFVQLEWKRSSHTTSSRTVLGRDFLDQWSGVVSVIMVVVLHDDVRMFGTFRSVAWRSRR